MGNEICHVEIPSTDLGATKRFLGELLDWTFSDLSPEYALFSPGAEPGGGITKVDTPAGEGGIQIYIRVDSIEETLASAEALGGATVAPKTEIGGGYGFYGTMRDPGGTVLGIWQKAD